MTLENIDELVKQHHGVILRSQVCAKQKRTVTRTIAVRASTTTTSLLKGNDVQYSLCP